MNSKNNTNNKEAKPLTTFQKYKDKYLELKDQAKSIKQSIDNEVKGYAKPVLDLRNERLSVCNTCPLFKRSTTRDYCDPDVLYNAKTGELRKVKDNDKPKGFIKGCGCTLNNKNNNMGEKTTVIGNSNTCPGLFWEEKEKQFFYIKDLPQNINTIELGTSLAKLGVTMTAAKYKCVVALKDINKTVIEEHGFEILKRDLSVYAVYDLPSNPAKTYYIKSVEGVAKLRLLTISTVSPITIIEELTRQADGKYSKGSPIKISKAEELANY